MTSPHPTPALRFAGASVGYGAATVLRALDLEVAPGELVGLVGPSGSGKTTVLRALTGQADVHGGTVEVLGQRCRRGRTPPGIGYVPQLGGVDLSFPLTVEQVVLLGGAASSRAVPWFSRAERRRAAEVLEQLGLAGLQRRHLDALSGGQLQRTFLARALVDDRRLLLLDEPTSGVDLATRREVLEVVGELHADGLTIVLTTHDVNLVAAHLPRIVCLAQAVVADGRPGQVLTPQVLERTYGAALAVIEHAGRPVVVDDGPVGVGGGR